LLQASESAAAPGDSGLAPPASFAEQPTATAYAIIHDSRALRLRARQPHEAVRCAPDLALGRVVDHVPLAGQDGQRALRRLLMQSTGVVARIHNRIRLLSASGVVGLDSVPAGHLV